MRIAYCTTDDMNCHLAEEMAATYGLTLFLVASKDPPPNEGFDAVIYDWDYWPVGKQSEVLAELLAGHGTRAVAVHGYNLDDGQAEALRRQAVAVYRRLQAKVFRFLRRAVRTVHAATALSRIPQDRQATAGTAGTGH
jgi:hypothetical protein